MIILLSFSHVTEAIWTNALSNRAEHNLWKSSKKIKHMKSHIWIFYINSQPKVKFQYVNFLGLINCESISPVFNRVKFFWKRSYEGTSYMKKYLFSWTFCKWWLITRPLIKKIICSIKWFRHLNVFRWIDTLVNFEYENRLIN